MACGGGVRVSRCHAVTTCRNWWRASRARLCSLPSAVAVSRSPRLASSWARASFGASGFRYCGSILSPAISAHVAGPAIALVDAVTAAFPLVGVGAIDFIATDEGLSPVEVNPRWSASMELVERARGVSMFGIHADACAKGVLPRFDLRDPVATGTYGKAILFARRDVVAGDIRTPSTTRAFATSRDRESASPRGNPSVLCLLRAQMMRVVTRCSLSGQSVSMRNWVAR